MRLSPETSRWVHDSLQPLKRGLLELRAASHTAGKQGRIPIRQRAVGPAASVIQLAKDPAGRLEIAADLDWLQTRNGFSTAWRRIGVFVDLLVAAELPAGSWQADLGDWVRSAGPVAGFSSPHADSRLVPDRGFFRSAGYRAARRLAARGPQWADRTTAVVWRGGPNGHGLYATPDMDWRDDRLRQRVRLCLLGQVLKKNSRSTGLPVDLRLVSVPHHDVEAAARLRSSGLLADPMPAHSWRQRQFAVDIDGYANAFSNFFVRLLFGCCVLKVASPRGFRQWYYDRLKPWVHYVPVSADLSDFGQRLDWCQRHPRVCRDIARAGQQAAFAMTYARERRWAVEQLAAAIT